jgi:hypothetical protein
MEPLLRDPSGVVKRKNILIQRISNERNLKILGWGCGENVSSHVVKADVRY